MVIIGLTGGIAMGKSTLAAQLAAMGAKICNADTLVHQLLSKGGEAVDDVGRLFPGTVKNGVVDRKALGNIVFNDKVKLKELESLLHPLVMAAENRFIHRECSKGTQYIVLDIPLLFETGGEKRCDVTIVATAPSFMQKQRAMKRPGMTEDKFHRIVASQMTDCKKRAKADFVVPTGLGKGYSYRKIVRIMSRFNAE